MAFPGVKMIGFFCMFFSGASQSVSFKCPELITDYVPPTPVSGWEDPKESSPEKRARHGP